MPNALILVDIQRDLLPGGALPVPGGDEVIVIANRVQPFFDVVVATRDWHPPDHGSFADSHPGKQPGQVIELNGLPQILWPVHCVQHSAGAAFAPGLDTSRVSAVFDKGTDSGIDSYSGFFDNGHRKATGLGDWLKDRAVQAVFVLGLATDYCVKCTALDAAHLGFAVHLIQDGCRGVELNDGDVRGAIEEMARAGAKMVHSADMSSIRRM